LLIYWKIESIDVQHFVHDHDRPVLEHGPRSPMYVQVLTEIKTP